MPVDHTRVQTDRDFDQPASARSAPTQTGFGLVKGTMGGAHEPLASGVKKMIFSGIHLHGDVRTTVEISMHLAMKTNRKRAASLST
jgi:hypothetical protein